MRRGLNFYILRLKLLPGNIFLILSAHFYLLVSSSTENKSITVNYTQLLFFNQCYELV